METTVDSRDQNRINIFMAEALQMEQCEPDTAIYERHLATAKLAYYNMSIAAQDIAYDRYFAETGKNWR